MSYSLRAAHYEVEYQEERDVPFVLSLFDGSVRRVIELPCGAGRLSRHLARKAETLHVVDLESGMVSRAVAAASAAAPECAVHGHVQDMRSLSLDHCFDLAVLPREGLQLVPPREGERVLHVLAANIVPGGCILVDLARFCGRGSQNGQRDPDYYKPEHPDGVFSMDWARLLPGGGLLHRHSAQRDEGDSIVFDLNYREESESPAGWSSQMRLYRYDSDWVTSALPEGFELERVCGAYDGSPLGPESHRILAVCRKLPDTAQKSASCH